MHLDFKFDTTAIQSQFRKLQEVGKSDGLTRKIANVLWHESEMAFDEERTPEGEKWAALHPKTKQARENRGYDGKILQVRGDLVASLNLDYGDDFAMIGAAEPYGQYHQSGTKSMHARPFLGLGQSGQKEIRQIISNRFKEVLSDE
ncbi:TPA: phage virion morphogenesis protein [Haemophilus influenzae]